MANYSDTMLFSAIVVCLASAWLMLSAMERTRASVGFSRYGWMVTAALAGGGGVWATHFLAIIAFRPDFVFAFDGAWTAASALGGVALIGVPAATTAVTTRVAWRAAGGAVAGLGIAVMHATGIAALENCLATYPVGAQMVLAGTAALLFALAMTRPVSRYGRAAAAFLLVAAVCVVHFGYMANATFVFGESLPITNWFPGRVEVALAFVVVGLSAAAGIVLVSAIKVSEQKQQRELTDAALGNMSNGLLLVGSSGRVKLFNARLFEVFGLEAGAVTIGMPWQAFLATLAPLLGWSDERLGRIIANHEIWFAKTETTYVEHLLDDGRTLSVACRPVAGGGAVLTYDDVTAERKAQREVEHLAFHDALTGLPNRRLFEATLDRALADHQPVTVFMLDLDRFKAINDTLGHAAGDSLLIEASRRLKAACRHSDTVSRLGGDEFAVITFADDNPATVAERMVDALRAPFTICGRVLSPSGSVGFARRADAVERDLLMQYADLALLRAKTSGKGQACGYEKGMKEDAVRKHELQEDLIQAGIKNELSLDYQPIFRLDDLSTVGFEALLRWRHPSRGLVSPAEFIPIAEESGSIRDLGLWGMREAMRQAACWPPDVRVAINVSAVQVADPAFFDAVHSALHDVGLAAERVDFELTETALVSDGEQIAKSLRELRHLGIRVSMDDFGTGYSSLAHLRNFPIDQIKVDRSFVQAAPSDASAATVLQSVVRLANDLGLDTVGEGVETKAQLDLLRRCGCQLGQGFLVSRPVAAAQTMPWLAMAEHQLQN